MSAVYFMCSLCVSGRSLDWWIVVVVMIIGWELDYYSILSPPSPAYVDRIFMEAITTVTSGGSDFHRV